MKRCRQVERTAEMGNTTRGTRTFLIIEAFSTMQFVPVSQAMVKKLNGTRPQSTNTGKCSVLAGKILVKTKVITSIITEGFRSDQNTPNDILRYRIRKSFRIRHFMTKRSSPCHTMTPERDGNSYSTVGRSKPFEYRTIAEPVAAAAGNGRARNAEPPV